jgi:hypothetical protein
MKQATFDVGTEHLGLFHPDSHLVPKPTDTGTSSAGPLIPVTSIVGFVPVFFDFFNEGGPNNLLPGRVTTQTVTIPNPGGSPFFVMLRGVHGAFVTDGRAHLTARPLGSIGALLSVPGVNTVACTIRLSDDNADDPVIVQVWGWAVLFR